VTLRTPPFVARLALASVLAVTALPSLAAGGGTGGGGGTTPPPPTILPLTAPAPGVLYRESFGMADLARPTGGKGTVKPVSIHNGLNSYWIEYPGSKNTAWLAPEATQTWRFAACSDDANEMPSPLQVTWGNGCIISDWFDGVTSHPTALMPFKAPSTAYEISMDGYPAPLPGAYVAIGLTGSALLVSNLETAASLWLVAWPNANFDAFTIPWELRMNGLSGPVLASGVSDDFGFDPMALRYDPVAQTASAVVDGLEVGPFPVSIPAPKYVGFEGVGVLDNFVVRLVP